MKILKRIERSNEEEWYSYQDGIDKFEEKYIKKSTEYIFEHDGDRYRRLLNNNIGYIQCEIDHSWFHTSIEFEGKLEELFQKELSRIERIKKLERICDGTK